MDDIIVDPRIGVRALTPILGGRCNIDDQQDRHVLAEGFVLIS